MNMEYLKEAAEQYPYHILHMSVRKWGILATLHLDGGITDHAFDWEEIERGQLNPITNWVEYILGASK